MTSLHGAALPLPPAVPRRLPPEVEAQCAATAARPLHRLVEAWWDVAAVERMGESFAGTDDTLPTLNAIAFEFAGDDLLAVATDRYTLGVARLPIAATHVQPRRLLRLSDVDALAKMFKPARGLDPMLAIEFGTEGLAVETTLTLDGQPTMRAAFPWYDRTGLGWRSLAPTDFVAISSCAFNPKYLEKFTHIVRGAESVHLWPTHANKPWRVTVGDHFTGLIMPVRQEASDWAPAAMNEPPAPKVRAPRAKATATKKAAA